MTHLDQSETTVARVSPGGRSVRTGSVRRITFKVAAVSALSAVGVSLLPVGTTSASPLRPGSFIEAPVLSTAIAGLSQGAQGDDVRALQQALLDAGITVRGGADGIFGPATRQAVIDFQNARGLSASGSVDAATADALETSSAGSSTGSAGTSSSGYVGLARGASGDLVTDLQNKLIQFGAYLGFGANGTFDASTERGLRQVQAWNQLGVTGTVTQATAKLLGLSGNGATTPPAATTTPDSDASSDYVGLRRGDRGELVTAVQRGLQSKGYVIRGGADGIFGPATEAVLKAFQRANGVNQSGVVGEREAELLGLGSTSAPPPATAASDNPYVGLQVGARGDAVKALQQALLDAGVTVRGGADGVFGPATKSALVTYQRSHGLTADGVAGQTTVDQLGLGSGTAPVPLANTSPPPSSGNPYVGLKQGDNGPLVRDLQRSLQNLGFVIRGGADGSFGPTTTSVVKAFQRVNAISQTGVVTERGAGILGLDNSSVGQVAPPGSFEMKHFPMQGLCAFGDTWHAPRGGGRLHVGTDLIGAEGLLLYAVVDGTISKKYWDQPGALAGNGLRVAQDDGTYFTYLHLSDFAPGIEVGTKVKAGDIIGFNGNTGNSSTPHLHFEIHPGGGPAINPYPYLKAMDECDNTEPNWQTSYLS